MSLDFQNVWHLIQTQQPPEITHFQHKTHPGNGWWLKTCVPLVSDPNLYKIWQRITQQHSHLICITEPSWDWDKTEITNAVSIWCRDTIDVELQLLDGVFQYNIVPFEKSFNSEGKSLEKQILKFNRDFPGILSELELTNLISVTQLMSNWHTDSQAKIKRRMFEVIENEKDSSQTHQSTMLDFDRVEQ
jgi:hypothetical protein